MNAAEVHEGAGRSANAHATPLEGLDHNAASLPTFLPARMLNEYVYCPRLFFYEWVEGLFAHNADTVEGEHRHARIDAREDALPSAGQNDGEQIYARSVTLSSDRLGLIARIDLIEGDGLTVTPVDYKKGAPDTSGDDLRAWPADRAQLCIQALLLREHGFTVSEAVAYYAKTRQRVRITIDDSIVAETLGHVAAARQTAGSGLIPRPLLDSPKCPRCSLVGICLPDETRAAMLMPAQDPDGEQLWLIDDCGRRQEAVLEGPDEIRRLAPARDDARPVYVTGFGFTVGKSDEVLQIRDKGKLVQEVRLQDTSQLSAFGAVTITGPAVQTLCWADRPIAHFTYGGWFSGLTRGMALKNVFWRIAQFRCADNETFCLRLSRSLVSTKIRNQRTMLQRNHVEPARLVLDRLKQLAEDASSASSLESLLGLEGTAARLYFEQFSGMLKGVDDESGGLSPNPLPRFHFEHRNRRPPRDPVNALLSFGYALLVKDITVACHAVGLDPFVGFLHQPRFGRPALALDLMEGFRPLIADSAVLSAVNTRMVSPNDFLSAGDAVTMTPSGRKGMIRAYEQRMDQMVTHPVFGYRMSYRRVIEVQVRLLARYLTGEIQAMPGFETR